MTVDGELLLHAFELSFAPAVPLVIWFVLLRMVPADVASLSMAQLNQRYGKLEGQMIIPFFASAALCGFGWWWYLTSTLTGWLPRDEGAVHVVGMEGVYWGLPALFLGLVTSPMPMYLGLAPFLRGQFRGFILQQERKYGGFARTGFYVKACTAAITLPLLYCGWRVTANFLPDRIVMHHILAAPTTQPYDAVRVLEYAKWYRRSRHGLSGWSHMIRIRFADSTSWSGNAGAEDATRMREIEVLRYVAQRTGLPVLNVKD